ncbi:hypothetical protein DDB_G0271006 [Dictyostelium discoideum AX4]|uniref:Uncharacterized protein n=1 Tax=Dictyostelium discoideum TaxID=44689 RepID=Q55CM0_DICDI|nr:hypothetical protein DDB_G0271006 [Dictyostelium discoideum AX4]EAL72853.1 hypothetical protein DDB_G0271006 [Dictyostelium discoideum AX4]|eukprot:XP_646461.1 hypothetical protein DDB_G0271006 [Dictyostelium discoideum AX4]
MKISNSFTFFLLFLVSLCLVSNAQMFGSKCKLPEIPQTLDNGSQSIFLLAQLLQNNIVFSSYNHTFSKGIGSTFFSDPNKVSVYNSGENLHVEYKITKGYSGVFYSEDCTSKDQIPTSSKIVKSYSGGFAIMGSTYNYQYKLTLNACSIPETKPIPTYDIIQSYTYQHHLIDQGEFKNTPTHTHGNRLDRIYTQYNRIDPENIYTQVHQIPSSLSDHNPISTTISSPFQINKHKKRWILSPGTANDHEAINIINHLITNHNNTSINQFTNWSKVKSKIIKTLKNYQYNKDKQTQRAKQILLEKAAKFKHLEEQCIAEYNIICNKNKLHQNHTNILKKHINGEIPIKYLSAILNKRSKDAKIESIQYGNIITSDQIENAFVEFYTNLYSLQICCPITHQLMLNTWPIIKNEYCNGLDSPFIQDEVEAAIKTCNPNKSPGPDGVANAFYINHLNQVKPILTALFNDILENPHHITTEFTEGLIHTIYKKGNPLLISNRRPITLLNTDYKILSKVINARLLRILPFIINNNQTGFVPHRFIIDNININELINYLKSKNLPGIITLLTSLKHLILSLTIVLKEH